MSMLPPDFDGGGMPEEWDPDKFSDYAQAKDIWDGLGDYSQGSGISQEHWFDSIVEIRDYQEWMDEEGNFHVSFEFDFDDGGSFHGTRSIVT